MSLPRKYMVEKRVCGTCVHYRQHYVRSREGYYIPLWYGHCIHPWRRHPEPELGCVRGVVTETGMEPFCHGLRAPGYPGQSMAIRRLSGTTGTALGRFSSRMPLL